MPLKFPAMNQLMSVPIDVAIAAVIPTASAVTGATQADSPTSQEREAAEALALRLGMSAPISVRKTVWGSCEALLAESVPIVEGNKRIWQQLYMGRTVADTDMACPSWPRGSATASQGGWTAARSNLREITTWRFVHRGGTVDVRLGAGVSYAVAETLIRSLDERNWRDVRKPDMYPGLASSGRSLVEGIYGIDRSDRLPDAYEVRQRGLNLVLSENGPNTTLHAAHLVVY